MRCFNSKILVCVLFFVACKSNTSPTNVNEKGIPPTLTETTWDVLSFKDEEGTISDPGTVGIFIEFHEDSTFSGGSYQKLNGPTAHNSFKGIYLISNDSLFNNLIYITEVNEPEGSRLFEFATKINGDIVYEIKNDSLILSIRENSIINLEKRLEN